MTIILTTLLFVWPLQLPTSRDYSVIDPLSSFKVNRIGEVSANPPASFPHFVRLAHRIWRFASLPEDQVERFATNSVTLSDRSMSVLYRDRVVLAVSKTTGQLFGLGITPPTSGRVATLTAEECVSKVRQYYREVGGELPLALDEAYVDASNSPPDMPDQSVHVFLDYVAPGTSYRFRAGVEAIVDRTFGTPENMQIAERPNFVMPQSVVTKEQAVAAAIAAVDMHSRWNLFEAASQDAKFDVPGYLGMPSRPSARHRNLARTGTALLVYEVTVHNAAFETGQGRPFCQVYVDAESGEPIAIFPAYEREGGKPTPPKTFLLGKGEWNVGGSKGRILPCSELAPFADKQVLARQGKLWAALHFDSKSGLVWMAAAGKVQVGRPDVQLKSALQRAKPMPVFSMPAPAKS